MDQKDIHVAMKVVVDLVQHTTVQNMTGSIHPHLLKKVSLNIGIEDSSDNPSPDLTAQINTLINTPLIWGTKIIKNKIVIRLLYSNRNF